MTSMGLRVQTTGYSESMIEHRAIRLIGTCCLFEATDLRETTAWSTESSYQYLGQVEGLQSSSNQQSQKFERTPPQFLKLLQKSIQKEVACLRS